MRFKEDYEADLKDQIEGRRSESENRVKKLQESIHQMEKEQLMLREQSARAEELRRKAEELRVETLRSSDSLIDELKKGFPSYVDYLNRDFRLLIVPFFLFFIFIYLFIFGSMKRRRVGVEEILSLIVELESVEKEIKNFLI